MLRTAPSRVGRVVRVLLTTLHVVAVLALVEALIRWVPLPRLSRLLAVRVDLRPVDGRAERLKLSELPPRARRQLRCTWKVADAWPFSRGPCLRRALVGGHLLRDLEPAVRLGVAGSGNEIRAHAWLEIDGRPLEPVAEYQPFERAPSTVAG